MPSDQASNFEERLRSLYQEVRSLRTVVDILRDEIIKTNHRVTALEEARNETPFLSKNLTL